MRSLLLSLSVVLCVVLMLNSCKTNKNLANTKLSADDTIKVERGDTVFVKTVDNPSTGYIWKLEDSYNKKMLGFIEQEFIAPKSQKLGLAGHRVYKFNAQKKGVTVVKLNKVRGNQAPVDDKTYMIVVE